MVFRIGVGDDHSDLPVSQHRLHELSFIVLAESTNNVSINSIRDSPDNHHSCNWTTDHRHIGPCLHYSATYRLLSSLSYQGGQCRFT